MRRQSCKNYLTSVHNDTSQLCCSLYMCIWNILLVLFFWRTPLWTMTGSSTWDKRVTWKKWHLLGTGHWWDSDDEWTGVLWLQIRLLLIENRKSLNMSDGYISKAHCLFGYYYTIGNCQCIFTKFGEGWGTVRMADENVDFNPSLKLWDERHFEGFPIRMVYNLVMIWASL